MKRIAFALIDSATWMGGYNYLLTLFRTVCLYQPSQITPVLFCGLDAKESDILPFLEIEGVEVVRAESLNRNGKNIRLLRALFLGRDISALRLFTEHRIDIVFENATFYGCSFPLPAIAWIPDFQHRYMRHLFGFWAYWKREIGFQVQVLSGRQIMLSSYDSRRDCERFYPATRGRTHVVRFAIPPADSCDAAWARSVADDYGLPEHFFFLPNQFWTHKNHECVIRALHLLKEQGRNFVVAVSGKQADPRNPAHFSNLLALIKVFGVQENFRLLGLIPLEHVPALMRSCSALINPSFFEGWSTTVEEAKSMGTPMLLSNLQVHHEQSLDALFFDATKPDALAGLMANFVPLKVNERRIAAKKASEQALERSKQFAEEFCKLATQIVDKNENLNHYRML